MECCCRETETHLPLVELLWRGGPQADQTVVLHHCARALARWGEALHLRHVVQALLDVAEVAGFRRRFVVRVRVPALVAFLFLSGATAAASEAALQAAALLSQLHLALPTDDKNLLQVR